MSDNKISGVAATATAAATASSNTARSANIESTRSMSSTFLGSLPVTSETSARAASALNTAPTTAAPNFHANRLLASAASTAASVANQATIKPITVSSFAKTLRRFFFNEIELPPLPEKHRNLIIALTTGVAAGSALWCWYRAHINRQDRKDKIEFAMSEIVQYCETMPEEEWEAGLNDPENFIGLLHLEIVRNTKKILDNSERNDVLVKCKRHINNQADAHFRQRKRQKRQAEMDGEVEFEYKKLLEESGQVQVSEKGASVKEAGPLLGGPKLTPGRRPAGRRHQNIEWHKGSSGTTPERKTMPHYPDRGPFTPGVYNPPKDGRRPWPRPKHAHSPAIPSPLTRSPEAPSSDSHTPAETLPIVAPEVETSVANSPIAPLHGGTPPGYSPNQSAADGPQEGLRSPSLPLPPSSTPSSLNGSKHGRSSSSGDDDDEMPREQPGTRPSAPISPPGSGLQYDDKNIYSDSSSSEGDSPDSGPSAAAGGPRTQPRPSLGGKTLNTNQIVDRAFDPNALGNRPYQSPVLGKRKKLELDNSGRPRKSSRFEGVPAHQVNESKGYWGEILNQSRFRELRYRIFGTAPAQKVQEPGEQAAKAASPVQRYQEDEETQRMEDRFKYEDNAREQLVGEEFNGEEFNGEEFMDEEFMDEEFMDEESGAGAASSDVNAAPTTSDLLGLAEEILDAELQEAERGIEEEARLEQQRSVLIGVNEAPVPSSPPLYSLSPPPANPTVPVLLAPVAAAVAVAFSSPAVQNRYPTVTAPPEPAVSPQRGTWRTLSQQLETVQEVDEGPSPSPEAEAATGAETEIPVEMENPPHMAPPARNTRAAAARRATTNPPSSSVSALPSPSRPPRRLSASRIPTSTRQTHVPSPGPVVGPSPAPPAPKRRASGATPAPKRRTPAATPTRRREPTAAPVAEAAPTPGTRQSSRATRFQGRYAK